MENVEKYYLFEELTVVFPCSLLFSPGFCANAGMLKEQMCYLVCVVAFQTPFKVNLCSF